MVNCFLTKSSPESDIGDQRAIVAANGSLAVLLYVAEAGALPWLPEYLARTALSGPWAWVNDPAVTAGEGLSHVVGLIRFSPSCCRRVIHATQRACARAAVWARRKHAIAARELIKEGDERMN